MTQEYKLIQGIQNQITFTEPALLTTLVGNKGGGKNTFMVAAVDEILNTNPKEVILSNTRITGAIFIPDILKWLAMKLMRQDETWVECFIDEAAIAGLESRGSYKEARALDSYLFTLSRKVNANIFLSSQLLSMIEKRSQWISDFYILCESKYEPDYPLPDRFEYTVYDNTLTEVNVMEIAGDDARDYLFRRFRTQEIPFQERLERDFISYYGISDKDLETYDEVMGLEPREKVEAEAEKLMWAFNRKSFILGSKIIMGGEKFTIAEKIWNVDKEEYQYGLRSIA